MDFYELFEDAKASKVFKIKDIADLLFKDYDAVRMAAKRKSFSELEKKTITEHYFGNPDIESIANLNVNDAFEIEHVENNHSNFFIKINPDQYIMTMPLLEVKVQAGFLDNYQDQEYIDKLDKHTMYVNKPKQGKYIAFRVDGDSMDDGTSNAITRNSIVTARELQKHHWTNPIRYKDFEYWVIYTNQSRLPLLKQIIGHDVEKGIITCHSLNDSPEFQDFELHLNDVQALFNVVDVHRSVAKKNYY